MNYQRIYNEIINNAKSRGLNKKLLNYYTEKHHIVPRCMQGTNDKSNLALLTGREHYLCHYLLWKANKENKSLFYAYHKMVYQKRTYQERNFKVCSKQYEVLSKIHSEHIKESNKLRIWKDETLIKMSLNKTGKAVHSIEHKEKLKTHMMNNKNFVGKHHTEEHKLYMKEKMKIIKSNISDETRFKMKEAWKKRKGLISNDFA
jgi:hypothetical protein